MSIAWTDERVEILRRGYADRMSAAKIGVVIGCSRNAVIGKATRIGLTSAYASVKTAQRASVAKPIRKRPFRRLVRTNINDGFRVIETVVCDEPLRELPADEIPIEQRKQLIELTSSDCRWPYGDVGKGNFFFCGGTIEGGRSFGEGQPYCPFHCRIARGKPSRQSYVPGLGRARRGPGGRELQT